LEILLDTYFSEISINFPKFQNYFPVRSKINDAVIEGTSDIRAVNRVSIPFSFKSSFLRKFGRVDTLAVTNVVNGNDGEKKIGPMGIWGPGFP